MAAEVRFAQNGKASFSHTVPGWVLGCREATGLCSGGGEAQPEVQDSQSWLGAPQACDKTWSSGSQGRVLGLSLAWAWVLAGSTERPSMEDYTVAL